MHFRFGARVRHQGGHVPVGWRGDEVNAARGRRWGRRSGLAVRGERHRAGRWQGRIASGHRARRRDENERSHRARMVHGRGGVAPLTVVPMSPPAKTPSWRIKLALAGAGSVLSLALGEMALRA